MLFDISLQVLVIFLFRQAPGQPTSDAAPSPTSLPLAWVGQGCRFTLHSPYPLVLQGAVAKHHLTSRHRQTTSPPAALCTAPGTRGLLQPALRTASLLSCPQGTHLCDFRPHPSPNTCFQHPPLPHSHPCRAWARAVRGGQPRSMQAPPSPDPGSSQKHLAAES